MAELEAAIAATEATFTARRSRFALPDRLKALHSATLALLVGLVVGAGASTYIHANAAAVATEQEAAAMEQWRQALSDSAALMPEATRFIRHVVDAVVERQKTDRAALEANPKWMIPLEKFDPALAEQMPKSLPKGTAVVLRADATNLKVLMNWTLCGVASVTNPELVDRQRASAASIGCPYFGLWTDGAATW